MKRNLLLVVATMIAVFAVTAMAADDPFVGTWKLNLAKSKYSDAPPKSFTLKIEVNGINADWIADLVDAEGRSTHRVFPVIYDGKAHQITNGLVQKSSKIAERAWSKKSCQATGTSGK